METQHRPKTALLIMDIQEATVQLVPQRDAILQRLNQAIATARARQIPVIYVVIGFRSGYPEVSPNNKSAAVLKSGNMNLDTEEGTRVHAAVEPAPGEVVVVKKRVSAFAGSDLELVLRAMGIGHLVLTGIATSGVVLSTLREAADKDFQLTVLSDCCADRDDEVHQVLTGKVFTRQAAVTTAVGWCAAI